MKENFSLSDLLDLLKEKNTIIISCGLLGVILVSLFTLYIVAPQYSSTTQLLVNLEYSEENPSQGNNINQNLQLINTYTELIKGPAILNEVRENLGSDLSTEQLASKIAVISPEGALVFSITVTDEDPYAAAELANEVASTFQNEVGNIMNSVENVSITYEAVPKLDPISPNLSYNAMLGLLIGITVSMGFVLIQYFMDGTLKDEKFVSDSVGWNNLGEIYEMTEDDLQRKERQRSNQRRYSKKLNSERGRKSV